MLSQFVGGMAAPLFLFMAGMTLAFQMDSLDRRERVAARRWYVAALRRAGYILGHRLSVPVHQLGLRACRSRLARPCTKVDILNCMGFAMAVLAVVAIWPAALRARITTAAGFAIAALSPVMNEQYEN